MLGFLILNQPIKIIMNGIAKTYETPYCTSMELNCEGSFCLISSKGGLYDVDHDGFVGGSYNGPWDE